MKSDFEFQTKARPRRKWATSSRYLHAENDSAERPTAMKHEKSAASERVALALAHVHRASWGSPSQFLEANRGNDDEITQNIIHLLEQMPNLSSGQVRVEVESGWVTLHGQMDWNYQHARITAAIRYMAGVDGLVDELTIKPRVQLTLSPRA
ncbi:BON domain-containing protein [Silvimonas iriomotensis]|uniref:BON domain-containing protein n=1 Tax=Silvimonas iriomotensis TaxID=449662 RepID=A0ABQ2P3V5_9NEIS|nr:BON domain-containing protein [Silvimonas iriomotensis]GGP17762.1 hypothetical protein GCM10010970_01420 [Silvimonas iriomotensis]